MLYNGAQVVLGQHLAIDSLWLLSGPQFDARLHASGATAVLGRTCVMLPCVAGDVEALLETYDRQRRVLPMPMAQWSWGWTKSAVRRLSHRQLPSCLDRLAVQCAVDARGWTRWMICWRCEH